MAGYLQRNQTVHRLEPAQVEVAIPTHFAVIPVYDENEHIANTLASIKRALQYAPEPVKTVLVINHPLNAPEQSCRNNQTLLESLRKNDGQYDGGLSVGEDLFFIDLTVKEIPDKFRNVGNARKTGFDEVIRQIDGKLTARKVLLFSLDADTLVAENYFSAAMEFNRTHPEAAGAVFHFEHRFESPDEAVNQAAVRYEIFLRDYAWQLRSCGSEFGFWTIGSAFMCNALDYMRCGGMRRNAAGEDFYFLQALRKVGQLGVVPDTTVYPSGRISFRVPFGTGPAISRQLSGSKLELYNPRCFAELKEFFAAVASSSCEELSGSIMHLAGKRLAEYLEKFQFADVWSRIVCNTPHRREALQHALHVYCDGFFILRFCHYLEQSYPQEYARIPFDPTTDSKEKLAQMRQRDRQQLI